MGIEVSSNSSVQTFSSSGKSSIQSIYYRKIYTENKKTMAKFKEQLKSITKRISYLPYPWVQQLRELLSSTSNDRLYSQYKQVLKENCLKEGLKEKIFYGATIVDFFERDFIQRKKGIRFEDSIEVIKKLVQEGKAFLMVLEWLHQLTSLINRAQQQIFLDPRQGWVSQIQERVCAGLLDLAQKYFQGRQINRMRKAHSLGIINNQKILFALSKLKKRISFAEREGVLLSVESMLGEDQDTFERGLELICQTFGKAAVLANIFVVQEMGRVKIARAWRFLVRETGAESADSK